MKKLLLILLLSTMAFGQSPLLTLMSDGYKNPETTLYLAGQTVSGTQAARIDQFITLVKTNLGISSLSDKFDVMYLFANESSDLGLRNLVKRSHDATLAGTPNPTFTQWQGFQGDGSHGYIKTNYIPSMQGVKYTQNSASFGYYAKTLDAVDGVWDMGTTDGTSICYMGNFATYGAATSRIYLNSASPIGITQDTIGGVGFKVFTRNNATQVSRYFNGGYARTLALNSNGIPSKEFYICGINNNGTAGNFTNTKFSFAFISGGLSSTDVVRLTNCIEWYMDDLGEGVIAALEYSPSPYENTVSPNDFAGSTQTERIQNALLYAESDSGTVIELAIDSITFPYTNFWEISQSLEIPSYTTLYINNATLKMKDGVFDTMVRNKGIQVNPAFPFDSALALNQNEGIKILGSGIGTAIIENSDIPYTAKLPFDTDGSEYSWVGSHFGWRAFTGLFANVKDLEIGNITFKKSHSWTLSFEHGDSAVYIHDVDFQTANTFPNTPVYLNGDGIHLNQGCKYFTIENITGATNDDVVGIFPLVGFPKTIHDSTIANYPTALAYPMVVGSRYATSDDSICNITIDSIYANSGSRLIGFGAGGGAKLFNVTVNNIYDLKTANSTSNCILFQPGYGGSNGSAGDMHDINITNVTSNYYAYVLRINAALKDCSFIGLTQNRVSADVYLIDPPYNTQQVNVVITP